MEMEKNTANEFIKEIFRGNDRKTKRRKGRDNGYN